ncbi:MAG: M3 family metallopeptidase [Bacteroidales bacterium]|nr:M3 family metallopeptidase [Bacteroidales bacterium]
MNIHNPLTVNWNTPYEAPPFSEIKAEHYIPAIKSAIDEARNEIAEITSNPEPPSFSNTVEALERTGRKLNRITQVLFNLNSAETSPEIQAAAMEASPLLSEYANDVTLNDELFFRIEQVYRNREYTIYNPEQSMLLEKSYRNFITGGAGLRGDQRKRYREISSELSLLSLRFEENVLAETNDFTLHIESDKDLAGLPDAVKEAAAAEAEARNLSGWIFTLHAPSFIPFMQYSEVRRLREKMYKAYTSRAFRKNKYDNREIVGKITSLRLELARLLGYPDYASLVLEDRMAENPDGVKQFLNKLLTASLPAANADFKRITEYAAREGLGGDLQRWDWSFYSEKLKKETLAIDDEILRPYFKLESVINAVFDLATKLYGTRFKKAVNIPVYHPDVTGYEVLDGERVLALLWLDFHPRKGKSGGAWMTTYRDQHLSGNDDIRPLVSLVMNFTKPGNSTPSLLTHNELTTLLHEFGHALHAIFSECTYESLSGTSVMRDFVELPSQIMENWAYEKEWLDTWAEHYQTGVKIPAEIIEKLTELARFNEGYACLRQLSFALLDMAWHTIRNNNVSDVTTFERNAMVATELFPEVSGTNMSVAFGHLFGGGYAAGYYGYKWAEVLDADAFSLFAEKGIFDRETAISFRKNILERGGTIKPAVLYRNFRGREPSIEPLLRRSGFIN